MNNGDFKIFVRMKLKCKFISVLDNKKSMHNQKIMENMYYKNMQHCKILHKNMIYLQET